MVHRPFVPQIPFSRIFQPKVFVVLGLILLCLGLVVPPTHAAQVTLVWIPPDAEFGGFILAYGTNSEDYSELLDIGNQTTYTLTGLDTGQTYFFAVKAYDLAHEEESVYSNEVTTTIPEPKPDANFLASPTTGAGPLSVDFTDTSSGNIGNWSWDFGDGTTSTQRHPSHTYQDPGSYSISLTVTGSGGTDTRTKADLVVVTAPALPEVVFTASETTGLAPFSVSFSDSSSGNISSWEWDFGDGASSTLQHPSHTYTETGTYAVQLTVSGSAGSQTLTKSEFITVTEPPPAAGFSATPMTGKAPLAVTFTDLSSGTISTWNWDFGDGETSTVQHPTHTYTTAGIYSVGLTVSGPLGSQTLTQQQLITVGDPAPVAAFSGTPLSGVAPLPVTLTDLSSGPLTSWAWTFGDGGTSTDQHPQHTYTKAGRYAVQLTVTGPGGTKTVTKEQYVVVQEPAPVAAFSGTPLSGVAPLPVTLTDLSSGPLTSWAWTFGDGGTSTDQHPQHTYTKAGRYAVQLTVTGPGGTKTVTKEQYVVVQDPAPVAAFSGTPLSGVAPLPVTLTDLSSGPLTSWAWTFGDGGTSTDQHPQHTYTKAGRYAVQLTVTGPGGTKTVTKEQYVVVQEPAPVAAFSGTPLSGVAPLPVTLTDLSSGPLTSWAWTFGDGGTSTDQHPQHTYTKAGHYAVQLTVTGPGGTKTVTKEQYVVVQEPAPVAAFSGTPLSGVAPLPVTLTDLSSGPLTSWAWTFGDGGTSTDQHPQHTYTKAGHYAVQLTVTGPGGTKTVTKEQYVVVQDPAPVAAFSGTPLSGVAPLPVTLTDLSSGPLTSWAWTFGDGGTSTDQHPQHTYTKAGRYAVQLTVTGPGGTKTVTKEQYVVVQEPAPVAAFSGTPLSGVAPLPVTLTDLSSGPLTSWAWTFGDGGTSTDQHPQHTYTKAGHYAVQLTVTGPGGTKTVTKEQYVVVQDPAPVAAFSGTPLSGVAPLPVTLTDLSSGPLTSWAWTFGDGGTSTDQHPQHTYTKAGRYAVQLTVTGPGGTKTVTKEQYVVVQDPAPVAAFSGTPLSGVAPLPVTLTDLSAGPLTSWAWTFGDGSTSTDQHPKHTYTKAGRYAVQLTVTGPGGTKTVTKEQYVVVQDPAPVAAFSGTPLSGVAPLPVTLTDLSSGPLTSWAWTFGDGGTSTDQHPQHTYTKAGRYAVQLTVTGPGGTKTVTKEQYVVVQEPAPVAAFSGTPLSGVAPLPVTLTDLSAGPLTSWAWTFGDGSTSTDQHPKHTYTKAGRYAVQLTVTGPGGTKTVTKEQYVVVQDPAPVAAFSGTPLSGVAPLPVTLTDLSSGPLTSWAWTFGDGGTSTDQHPEHTYTKAGSYAVQLTVKGPGGTKTLLRDQLVIVREPVPFADFHGAPVKGSGPLPVTFSDSSTGAISNWLWTFGDGTSSTKQHPNHTYNSPGQYSVGLTVSGPGGTNSFTRNQFISVENTDPELNVKLNTAPESQGKSEEKTIEFVKPESKENNNSIPGKGLGAANPATGQKDSPDSKDSQTKTNPKSVSIDSTEEVKQPVSQPVSQNGGGSTKSGSPLPQQTPLTQTIPFQQLSVSVAGLGVTSPTAVKQPANRTKPPNPRSKNPASRNEGSNNSGDTQRQNHENYDANHQQDSTDPIGLTFEDSDNSQTGEENGSSPTSNDGAPTAKASFTAEPMAGSDPLAVSFSDNSSGSITSWLWDFGDGTTSASPNPSHQFTTPGEYPITLTVTDANGESISTRKGTLRVGNQNQGAPKNVSDHASKEVGFKKETDSQEKSSKLTPSTITKASIPTDRRGRNSQKP